jgi:hypothetical protein
VFWLYANRFFGTFQDLFSDLYIVSISWCKSRERLWMARFSGIKRDQWGWLFGGKKETKHKPWCCIPQKHSFRLCLWLLATKCEVLRNIHKMIFWLGVRTLEFQFQSTTVELWS